MIDEIEDHKSRGLKGARNFFSTMQSYAFSVAHSPKKVLSGANLTDFNIKNYIFLLQNAQFLGYTPEIVNIGS